MLAKYISIPAFLSSFIIGLVFIYFWGPETKIIHKYPSPSNYKAILYKDKVNKAIAWSRYYTLDLFEEEIKLLLKS